MEIHAIGMVWNLPFNNPHFDIYISTFTRVAGIFTNTSGNPYFSSYDGSRYYPNYSQAFSSLAAEVIF